MNKSKKKILDPLRAKKPTVKDGFHYRWWLNLDGRDWEVVQVGPWDNKEVTFNRAGFPENNPTWWVSDTKKSQWGKRVERD